MKLHKTAQHRIHELQHRNKLRESSIQPSLTLLGGNSTHYMAWLTKNQTIQGKMATS